MSQKVEHERKLKMARKMLTQSEIKAHVSPFDGKAWNDRKKNKANKAHNREVQAGYNKK